MTGTVKCTFAKTSQTSKQHLEKLKQQGLTVADEPSALRFISFVGHYRLKGYWYQLQNSLSKQFDCGTTFDDIVARYECDRELRALILEGVGQLEVAVRATICNQLSAKHTPHWFLNPSIFKPSRDWGYAKMLSKIENEVNQSKLKRFISSYYEKHDDPYMPPSWAMSECVTLGLWSRTYAILRNPSDKKEISSKFRINKVGVFESWLHTLSVLRNMAAHHDRFLDTKLGVSPQNYKARNIRFSDNKTVYSALTMMHILLESMHSGSAFKSKIIDFKERHGSEIMQLLRFPKDWPTGEAGW